MFPAIFRPACSKWQLDDVHHFVGRQFQQLVEIFSIQEFWHFARHPISKVLQGRLCNFGHMHTGSYGPVELAAQLSLYTVIILNWKLQVQAAGLPAIIDLNPESQSPVPAQEWSNQISNPAATGCQVNASCQSAKGLKWPEFVCWASS